MLAFYYLSLLVLTVGLVIALPTRGSWRIPLEIGSIQCYANGRTEKKNNTVNAPFVRLTERLTGG